LRLENKQGGGDVINVSLFDGLLGLDPKHLEAVNAKITMIKDQAENRIVKLTLLCNNL